jgi:acyl-CoA synthetase (AMP-forming)/AMP-acid ligase II
VTLIDRSPDAVLSAVDKWGVELLPTSPTFLNLVLISEAYKRYSLRTLKTVTYGTEPMPESTLAQITKVLPHVQFLQTYGLSEIGILRSKSKSSDSLWVKIGGEGFQTRVVDGLLEVKAQSAMLGYLNAESPFTTDGWFKTGDMVEQDGDYFKILGRKSEIINVGGEKVYPAEVESVVLEVEGVEQVTVFGERNAITGQMVVARVKPASNIEPQGLTQSIRKHCQSKLARYKVPVKVLLSDEEHHTERFKRDRQRVGRAIE